MLKEKKFFLIRTVRKKVEIDDVYDMDDYHLKINIIVLYCYFKKK